MKVTRQLNIKDKSDYFFTDMINVNNFDSSLLHVDRTVIDYDFVKNLNKMDNLYLVFTNLDAVFRKSGKNKYLIFTATEKNKVMLESYIELFDETADQIELMSDDKVMYCRDIMRMKFKTSDNLVLNVMINIPVCAIVVSSVFKENDYYYPQISLNDCFYEYDNPPDM